MRRRPRESLPAGAPRRARSRGRTAIVAGFVATALVAGGWFASRPFIAEPKPRFATTNGVEFVYDYPLNAWQQWDGHFGASVRHGSATIFVLYEDGRTGRADLEVDETATISGVTVTLCGTWVAPLRVSFARDSGEDFSNQSTAYIVQSTDGPAPECPERTN